MAAALAVLEATPGQQGWFFPFVPGAAPELIEKSAMFACVAALPPPLCPLSLLPSDISSLSQQMGALKVSAEGDPRGVRSLGNWSPGMALWDGEGKACRVSIRDHAGAGVTGRTRSTFTSSSKRSPEQSRP